MFWNTETDEASFDRPDNVLGEIPDAPTNIVPPGPPNLDTLTDHGWREVYDYNTGVNYYWNENTDETSWDSPFVIGPIPSLDDPSMAAPPPDI